VHHLEKVIFTSKANTSILLTAAGIVEKLTANTAATNRGDGNFLASLEQARETQDETHSTAI
jgi:hypothetical protein